MRRLLNIKEAAGYLNVSEMTMRRWTNAGVLRCYRVGGKRERRFDPEDLYDYLSGRGTLDKKKAIPLGFGDLEVPDGAHLTQLCIDAQEALDAGVSYLLEGLDNNETVLLVAPEVGAEKMLAGLRKRGVDVDAARQHGRLNISDGMDSPAEQAELISRVISSASGRFRLFGDMRWTNKKGWPLEKIRELENMGNASLPIPGKLFLCQYSLKSFSGEAAMMAMETHVYAIYREGLKESPYFKKDKSLL